MAQPRNKSLRPWPRLVGACSGAGEGLMRVVPGDLGFLDLLGLCTGVWFVGGWRLQVLAVFGGDEACDSRMLLLSSARFGMEGWWIWSGRLATAAVLAGSGEDGVPGVAPAGVPQRLRPFGLIQRSEKRDGAMMLLIPWLQMVGLVSGGCSGGHGGRRWSATMGFSVKECQEGPDCNLAVVFGVFFAVCSGHVFVLLVPLEGSLPFCVIEL